ncbi:helix-turn-helix transcriptional regulator [Sporosarcina sp. Te-1]|uniref:ArsR/SmtB family transcription factor n=1 Tax=Sporosarcina sp. Te-1 TaxID=2818390 RepID=UPI001A9EF42A|nr:winged helix-turn-helix domain-containing protein [Sporosarcina sp. Te-1]QTD39755.1 winged helix-turn-helix transcriptional regulator [Sporosarcina sp. Te-1]
MNTLSITGRKKESYSVVLEYSLLWESALGIAAFTNTPLLDTLEKEKVFETLRRNMPDQLLAELKFVEANNTWKSLLQLLHVYSGNSLDEFTSFLATLSDNELKYHCFPFTGARNEAVRSAASTGDLDAVKQLQAITGDISFFPAYITFIHEVNGDILKEHLIKVLTLWHEIVIQPDADHLLGIASRDMKQKRLMKEKLSAEEFVTWATGGTEYAPEPGVHQVLLIPQMCYRPWTIVSDIENTKVFYYPIPSTSIHPDDPYLPDYLLVHKYKALGDETRLRMIKLLSEKDYTLKEMTEQLNIGKSTAHHHLKLLRAASLVGIRSSKYVLKTKSITSLPTELQQYLEFQQVRGKE